MQRNRPEGVVSSHGDRAVENKQRPTRLAPYDKPVKAERELALFLRKSVACLNVWVKLASNPFKSSSNRIDSLLDLQGVNV
jgi:hypothetical protein